MLQKFFCGIMYAVFDWLRFLETDFSLPLFLQRVQISRNLRIIILHIAGTLSLIHIWGYTIIYSS